MGATALTAWLRARVLEATTDNNDEERSRRLESDAEAVQVLTMHRSKGLEFPVVYYPDLWEPTWIPREKTSPVTFHDADGVRTIDVGLDGPQWNGHVAQHIDEQRGEDLRLAYVALTRAKHQAVVWWAGSFDSRNSPLSRLLFARDDSGNVAPSGAVVPSDETALARFRELAGVSVASSSLGPPVSWPGEVIATSALSSSSFDRDLDWWWRRTSFSDITAGTYEAHVASEPEEPVVDDEATPPAPPVPPDGDDALRAVPSLLADMPVGVEVGTLVHRVFEAVDFASADLSSELSTEIATALARRRVELGDVDAVVAGLHAAIETPLADGVSLRAIARTDRLDELNFELPLVGGDDPRGPALTLAAIAEVLRAHGDPYADRLLDPRLRESVRGYLTGSIDLVLRLDGERFAVVDYKTNWLAAPGEELTAWHHRPVALSAEMTHAHYRLQALLYVVALHRYLRWRLPRYSASRNLAGAMYLFVRGMTGPDTPVVDGTPCGVFTWQPSPALVEELSDVLDGGST
jgi:exodeoxyribonuclease V beta subunit